LSSQYTASNQKSTSIFVPQLYQS